MELEPEDTEAKRLLADVALPAYLSDSRHPKLLHDALRGLAAQFLIHDVDSFDGFRLEAYLAVSEGNATTALADFRRANQIKPMQPDVVLALAQTLLQDKSTAGEGERLLRELINRRPDVGLAYDLLYRRYEAANRLGEAEAILIAKLAANPHEAEYATQLADHYRRTGKTAEMAATLAALLDNPKQFHAGASASRRLLPAGWGRGESAALLQAGFRSGGAGRLVYCDRLVAALIASGRPDEALEIAAGTLKAYPHDVELRTLHALLLTQLRQLDEAILEWQGLVKEKSTDPVLHFHLGRSLILNGRANDGGPEGLAAPAGLQQPTSRIHRLRGFRREWIDRSSTVRISSCAAPRPPSSLGPLSR